MKRLLSKHSWVDDIKAGGSKRQRAIEAIYKDSKLKNQVLAFVAKNSGSRDEGIDIFHEGIIALDANIRNGKYRGEGEVQGYLYSTCRFLWLNKLKRSQRMEYTDDTSKFEQIEHDTPETLSLADEQKDILRQLLGRLGDKCQKILELWKLSYSMEEIAEKVGLGNAGIARRQRYNCYQKLMKIIEQEPQLLPLLKN